MNKNSTQNSPENATITALLKRSSRVTVSVHDGSLVPQSKLDRRRGILRIHFHQNDLPEFEQALSESKTLEWLQCSCSQINLIERIVAALKINTSVNSLSFASSKLSNPKNTEKILQLVGDILTSNEKLKTLRFVDLTDRICNNDSFFQFVGGLRKNTSVRSISMPKIPYTQEQAIAFIEAIKGRPSKLAINFESFHITTESMKVLALFMKANIIESVKISKRIKNFVIGDLNPVFEALKETTSVTELTLRLKKYHDRPPQPLLTIEECKSFAEALKTNKSIRRLCIIFNGLGSERISIILNGLQHNRSITNVDFNHNELTNEIAPAVGSLIKFNKFLTALELKETNFTAEQCKLIAAGLKVNKTLRNLRVQCEDQTGALIIASALKYHQCLRYIEIDAILNIDGYNKLYKIIKKNLSLTYMSIKFDKSVDEPTKKEFFDLFYRNKQYRIDTIIHTIMALIQIGRSEQFGNIFPIEIWLRIFKHIACTSIPSFKYIAEQILMHFDLRHLKPLCKMLIERVKGKSILVSKSRTY